MTVVWWVMQSVVLVELMNKRRSASAGMKGHRECAHGRDGVNRHFMMLREPQALSLMPSRAAELAQNSGCTSAQDSLSAGWPTGGHDLRINAVFRSGE